MFKIIQSIFYSHLISVTPTPALREERIQGILDHRNPGRELEPSRADVYSQGKGRRVSIESEAATTHDIQAGLDDGVEAENIFDDPDAVRERGLPPCKRVGKEG